VTARKRFTSSDDIPKPLGHSEMAPALTVPVVDAAHALGEFLFGIAPRVWSA
jgi:hypothetical protein